MTILKHEPFTGPRTVLSILQEIAKSVQPVSFSSLKERCDTNAPTLSRLLKFLADEGWIKQVESGYTGGDSLYSLSKSLLGITPTGELLSSIVNQLSMTTSESAAYAEFHEDSFVFKAKCEAPSSYHYIDLYTKNRDSFNNGFGKLTLALQPEDLLTYVLKKSKKENLLSYYTDLKNLPIFISEEDTCTRVLASVIANNRFFGVIGVSTIFKNLPKDKLDHYRESVLAAAQKCNKLLQGVSHEQ